jgi:hypothetical protein
VGVASAATRVPRHPPPHRATHHTARAKQSFNVLRAHTHSLSWPQAYPLAAIRVGAMKSIVFRLDPPSLLTPTPLAFEAIVARVLPSFRLPDAHN